MKNITIIGGGACGTAVFIELVLQIAASALTDQVKLTIIEKEKVLGYGLAFGTDQPGHLLNTQAELIGIHVREPEHFSNWLKAIGGPGRDDVKGHHETDHTYTTRSLYGDYVAGQATHYLAKARQIGLVVEIIHAEAVDIGLESGRYEVMCQDGNLYASDFVVLALGTPKPQNYQDLRAHLEYIDFPWPSERILHKVHPEDHVGILGTSLSAIDAVMTLVDNGHQGPISLFSPDGMLPRVQPEKPRNYDRKILTLSHIHQIKRETLRKVGVKDIFGLFQQEVDSHAEHKVDWHAVKREKKDAEELLDRDIALAEKGGDELSDVIYSLRYDADAVWQMWDIEEKKQFKRWLGSYWMAYRHAMPLYNAYRLKALFVTKQLKVFPGLEGVEFDEQRRVFNMKLEVSVSKTLDKLINATGSPSHLEEMGCPLVDRLLEKRYLRPYPAGGALIDALTMQTISPKGGEGIYAMGHLVNGMLLGVNSVWYNVRTAATLCQHLISKIKYGCIS
jgi:uncharacterized NAD(P)/FAD-binding protein YdhS